METLKHNIAVYSRNCIGCKNNQSDVMISVMNRDGEIMDIFLMQWQADNLRTDLASVIRQNDENEGIPG